MTTPNVRQAVPSLQPPPQAALPPLQSEAGVGQGLGRAPPQWANLPAPLKAFPHWCLSDSEKAPRTVTGAHASVSDPSTWTDFDTVSEAAARLGVPLGFMLSESDPFTCIDMDVKADTPPDHLRRYQQIAEAAESYVERSRGGLGKHVWVRATLDGTGARRDGVEVYDRGRFMICTGDVEIARPIEEAQPLIDALVEQMRPRRASAAPLPDAPALVGDEEVLSTAESAANGDRFKAHFSADFPAIGHSDHSRADMALLQMLAFYTPNNEQLRRLFLRSALGQRDKATKRADYLVRTIAAVRAAQAEGPSISHGKDMALAIFGSLIGRRAEPTQDRPVFSGADLLARLSIDWQTQYDVEVPDIIEGLVADEDVTLLGGHGGVGKSFLALQMACAAALGMAVLDRPAQPCRVLYYSAEDGRKRLTRRVRDIVDTFGYDADRLKANLRVLDASELEPLYGETVEPGEGRRSALSKVLGPRIDFANLQSMVVEHDAQLVIIDGASDTFDGNEIARREVRAFIKLLRRVHPMRPVAVLLMVHIDRSSARGHTTNDDGYAGSGQWHNSCRRRLFLQHQVQKERDDDGDYSVVSEAFVLRVMKNQDGPSDPDMELVRGPTGLWQPAVQISLTLPNGPQVDHRETITRLIAEDYVRDIFMSTSFAPQASTGVYAALKTNPEFPKGLNRRRTNDLLRDLERDGLIAKEPYRRANRTMAERWVVRRRPSETFEPAAPTAQAGTGST